MLTLQPVRFPRPVPIPHWTDNYADIGERIARDGRLDIEEIWLPDSGDGWAAFCGRHGTYNFGFEWDGGVYQERAYSQRKQAYGHYRETLGEEVRRQQAAFEAERRERQAAMQRASDALWAAEAQRRREADARRRAEQQQRLNDEAQSGGNDLAWWTAKNPWYATQPFFSVTAPKTGEIDGFQFVAGNTYVVPAPIAAMLR